ncbi:uncharacterized protein LOC120123929 [Hibiscus syriacus]|uniref:uncharacterized protein LOC120123929 n=1 Tax=Hibiscus syriacus TaxID=106335 RepID=UPI0019227B38|nr:uncharacterized protein LOC120123929 [Hibiscus syriacus]
MDTEQVEIPATALIVSEETGTDSKGKSIIYNDMTWQYQLEDDSTTELGNTLSLAESEKGSEVDLSYHDDDGDYDDYTDDDSDFGDNNELLNKDDHLIVQSLFDSLSLTPEESEIIWFEDPTSVLNGNSPQVL